MLFRAIQFKIIIFITIFYFTPLCFADGFFIPTPTRKLPEIPFQRALMKYHDGLETLIIEATLDGEGQDFGWIVPVPNIPERFEKISPGLLKTLSLQLEPIITGHNIRGRFIHYPLAIFVFISCVAIMLAGWRGIYLPIIILILILGFILIPEFTSYRGGPGNFVGIKIVNRQVVGDYETFVIEAQNSNELNAWLKENDFNPFPDHGIDILEDYIDNKWYFVAAKLMLETEGISTPHPILIEFETEKPVYPMRLTSLPGSDLYLELFILATKEAVPLNYPLKKGYCNIFNKKNIPSVIPYDYLKIRERFVGKVPLRPWPFSRGRKPLGEYDEIGHPDAEQIMWEGCVLTKLEGKLSSDEMSEDMYFSFENANPFISKVQSSQGARIHGEVTALIAFMIGFPILTVLYRAEGIATKRSFIKKRLMFVLMVSIITIVCVAIYAASYLGTGDKVEVVSLSGRSITLGWQDLLTVNNVLFDDLSHDREKTDAQLIDMFKKDSWPYGSLNPFTNTPITIEDSPGNITVDRDSDGRIIGIVLYWRDGTPFTSARF